MSTSRPKERASTRVARNIVSDIRARALGPGSMLDPEHVMVEKQGVARATVREALRFLELHGALRIKAGPGGGPVVSTPGLDHLTSALSLQLQFANATFRAVLEARKSIYPVLVAEAAVNASHQDILLLRGSLQDLVAAADDSDATIREARRFYELIAAASKNVVLGFVVSALHNMSEHPGIDYDRPHRLALGRQSTQMLLAIEQGDAVRAQAISAKTHAAALRYWEQTAPDLLNAPVAWMSA